MDDSTTPLTQSSPQGKLEATIVCEVVDVDWKKKQVQVLTRGDKGVYSKMIPLDTCPEPARIAGGTFFLDLYNKGTDTQPQYKVVPRAVDANDEKEKEFHRVLDELDRKFKELGWMITKGKK